MQHDMPPCPNPTCEKPHVVRNGRRKGKQHYRCQWCWMHFSETMNTIAFNLKTPEAEVMRVLEIAQQVGSLRKAAIITGYNRQTLSRWRKRIEQSENDYHSQEEG